MLCVHRLLHGRRGQRALVHLQQRWLRVSALCRRVELPLHEAARVPEADRRWAPAEQVRAASPLTPIVCNSARCPLHFPLRYRHAGWADRVRPTSWASLRRMPARRPLSVRSSTCTSTPMVGRRRSANPYARSWSRWWCRRSERDGERPSALPLALPEPAATVPLSSAVARTPVLPDLGA